MGLAFVFDSELMDIRDIRHQTKGDFDVTGVVDVVIEVDIICSDGNRSDILHAIRQRKLSWGIVHLEPFVEAVGSLLLLWRPCRPAGVGVHINPDGIRFDKRFPGLVIDGKISVPVAVRELVGPRFNSDFVIELRAVLKDNLPARKKPDAMVRV